MKNNKKLELFDNLITNAFEAGVSLYWCYVDKEIIPAGFDKKDLSDFISERVIKNKVTLKIIDAENLDDFLGDLNLENCHKAFTIMEKKYHHHFLDIINGDDDAITADIFLQLAIIGDVVFC